MISSQIKYIAFLRGINVGGNKVIPMKDLAGIFEKTGFKNVKTVLASGNVVFESTEPSPKILVTNLEKAIADATGFKAGIQIRKFDEIRSLVEDNPFKQFKADNDIHWYVTFLDGFEGKLPETKSASFQLLSIKNNALFSILYKQRGKSTDFMTYVDKTFGKGVTTRNWNTLVKIAATEQ